MSETAMGTGARIDRTLAGSGGVRVVGRAVRPLAPRRSMDSAAAASLAAAPAPDPGTHRFRPFRRAVTLADENQIQRGG